MKMMMKMMKTRERGLLQKPERSTLVHIWTKAAVKGHFPNGEE